MDRVISKSPVLEEATDSCRNTDCNTKSVEKWENYSPALLKRPISSVLKTTSSKRLRSTAEVEFRQKLLERDEQMMEELHRLEVQKRKVDLESAHISLQTDKLRQKSEQLRYQHLRDEHTIRMKMVNYQYKKCTGRKISSSDSESD